ncbi:alpha/beta hydrolase [Aporhodopirellula aestuarii]|uniref:Alpha/beta hydrolase n=1 Tax=Aporhodopirellula aestuarii TaxID=2950107 RepID=A0ABT0U6W6_9BACT|nr:alpha/beta hydrolase [Aporhodopirellula aestuarii]MCM2372531.1 alpha/beta hydrolase [Aporhodopirellula aestuarii]
MSRHFILSVLVLLAASMVGIPGQCDGQEQAANRRPVSAKVRPDMTEGVIAEGSLMFTYVDKKRRRRLTLDVYRPEKAVSPSPAIVMYFGGGWQNGRPGLFAPLAQALAQRGYVCVVPEYRLSGEAPFPAAIHDAKAAVRWTRTFAKRFNIDAERIACLGGSAGGHIAGFVAATNGSSDYEGDGDHRTASSEVQASVVMCGPMNLLDPKTVDGIEAAAKRPEGHPTIDFLQGQTPSSNRSLYREASPISHAGPHLPPMLFIDGELDNPGTRYRELRVILDQHNIPNEFVMMPDAPHPFWANQLWFMPTVDAVDAFLNKHL